MMTWIWFFLEDYLSHVSVSEIDIPILILYLNKKFIYLLFNVEKRNYRESKLFGHFFSNYCDKYSNTDLKLGYVGH